jgi:hypothetical protein
MPHLMGIPVSLLLVDATALQLLDFYFKLLIFNFKLSLIILEFLEHMAELIYLHVKLILLLLHDLNLVIVAGAYVGGPSARSYR